MIKDIINIFYLLFDCGAFCKIFIKQKSISVESYNNYSSNDVSLKQIKFPIKNKYIFWLEFNFDRIVCTETFEEEIVYNRKRELSLKNKKIKDRIFKSKHVSM